MKFLIRRKTVINELAFAIADLQKSADKCYYRNDPLKQSENCKRASWLLDQVMPLKNLAISLGIAKEVYQEAHKIYNFRNSGRDGYTLKDGKIVEEQHGQIHI